MSDALVKKSSQLSDGFADFDDTVQSAEGDGDRRSGSTLVGTRIKFTNEVTWLTADGTDITKKVLLVSRIRRTEVRWGDKGPLEVVELGPADKYRGLVVINDALPRSEWREDFNGKLVGPWKRQHIVEFVDLDTMAIYSWPTDTDGGTRAITELRDQTLRMRRFRTAGVFPLVELADTFMPTRFGGRQRPHLKIVEWVRPAGEGAALIEAAAAPSLPPPATPAPATPTDLPESKQAGPPTEVPAKSAASLAPEAPTTPAVPGKRGRKKPTPMGLESVPAVTIDEELNDEIPWK